MRVLIASAVYPPEPVVSARLSRDLLERLQTRGHGVQVICRRPSRGVARGGHGDTQRRPNRHLVVQSWTPDWFADGEPAMVCTPGRTQFTVMHGKSHVLRGTFVVLDAIARVAPQPPSIRVVMTVNGAPAVDPEAKALRAAADKLGIVHCLWSVEVRPLLDRIRNWFPDRSHARSP